MSSNTGNRVFTFIRPTKFENYSIIVQKLRSKVKEVECLYIRREKITESLYRAFSAMCFRATWQLELPCVCMYSNVRSFTSEIVGRKGTVTLWANFEQISSLLMVSKLFSQYSTFFLWLYFDTIKLFSVRVFARHSSNHCVSIRGKRAYFRNTNPSILSANGGKQ